MALVKEKSGLLKIIEERFDSFESGLNGEASSQIHQARKEAFRLLKTLDFPGRKNEEYKYTPITKILEKGLLEKKGTSVQHGSELFDHLKDCNDIQLIVFRDGILDKGNSTLSNQDGMNLTSLSEASQTNGDFYTYFNQAIPEQTDSFSLLNTSFTREGIFLHVEKNMVIKKPVVVLYINTGKGINTFDNPRNLLIFEEGSQAKYFECFESAAGASVFTNSFSEFIIKQNSTVEYVRLGMDSDNTIRVSNANILQENDSRFSATAIDFKGKAIRNNLNVVVDGTGCESNMFGLYLLNGTSHVDNHTMIDHKQPHCESNELYKGVLSNSARGVFNGKIYVRQDAQKTNAFQQNNNILLSDEATINTKPQLEIWADDVKCSHGCTSGQIDEEQIFYARSRGIDVISAKKMLLQAFAAEIINTIDLEVLRHFIETRVSRVLEEM